MQFWLSRGRFCLVNVILFAFLFVPNARAGVFYDIAIKAVYDDNVVGLLSDGSSPAGTGMAPRSGSTSVMGIMGSGPAGSGTGPGMYTGSTDSKNSDLSMNFAAGLGVDLLVGSRTVFFLAGNAERISYSSFSEFNMTAAGLATGFTAKLGDILKTRIAVSSTEKRFGDRLRNASLSSGIITLREQVSGSFWLKQDLLYEKNNADSSFFSYDGKAAGIRLGYLFVPATTVFLGGHYLVREYVEPADFEETARVISLGLEWEPVKRWFVDLQYDRRASDSSLPDTKSRANIMSLGLRYSY